MLTHVATLVPHVPDPWDNPKKLPPAVLASYAGAYEFRQDNAMVITVEDGQLVSQLGSQPKVPLFVESDGKFVARVVDAEIDFVKGTDGKVTSLELHQNGHEVTMNRLDDAAAKRAADEAAANAGIAAKRFAAQVAAPGSAAAIRRDIAELQAGEPKYDEMSEGLADATRQQLPGLKSMFTNFGAVKSVTFKGVAQNGADIYTVEFEHGTTEWRIIMASDGKIDSLNFRLVR